MPIADATRALGLFVVLFATRASAEPKHSSVHWETAGEVSVYHDTDAVNVLTPAMRLSAVDPLSGWSAQGSYLVDIVSAASVDIVSSASPNWVELRHAATLNARYKPGDLGGSISAAVSSEPDYLSLVAGGAVSWDFARKNATLELGYSYGHDVAGRTGTPFSVYSLPLDRHSVSGSLTLVLDRATTFSPGLDLIFESGRQEKPYRYLPIFDTSVASSVPIGASVEEVNALRLPGRVSERVPDTRQRYALSGHLAHRFKSSTLTLFDRMYGDSWGVLATTSDLRYVVSLGERWWIWPHFRFHLQSGASFWKRAYVGRVESGLVTAPDLRSGDRELSPLWSATLGPGIRWGLGDVEPRDRSLVLELEATRTRYSDALYVRQRWAGFAVVQFEARFP